MMNGISSMEAPLQNVGAASDYERVERAIRYLEAHYLEQPDLAAVARAAHLSDFHFQRLFTRWAGISPKRFLQFLTVEHAKKQLATSKAVLETTLDSGLSSPSRLHDLFVSVEAVTPGEYKSRGAGIRIDYGFHSTRFGTCLLGLTRRGVCWLGFVNGGGERNALQKMRAHWSGATLLERTDATAAVTDRIFSALETGTGSSLGALLMGTNFQLKVWQALLRIPAGALVSYDTLGAMAGIRGAARAVGSAVGANRVAYLIPCHRVIRNSGLLGGYQWGEPRKRAILAWEAAVAEHR